MTRNRRDDLRPAGPLTMFFLVWILAFIFLCTSIYSLFFFIKKVETVPDEIPHIYENKTGQHDKYHRLKTLLRNSKYQQLNVSDDFLARFSNARNDDAKKTFELMDNYFTVRKLRPDLFMNATASWAEFQPPLYYYQDQRTQDGQPIVYIKLGNWNTDKHTYLQAMSSTVAFAEYLSLNDSNIAGKPVITILDMSGFTLSHTFKVSEMDMVSRVTERSLALRPGPAHVCHNSWAVSTLFALMTPFMSEEVRSKLIFHGHDLTNLHAAIPKEILPKPVGGYIDLKSYTAQELQHIDTVLENYWSSFPAIF
ncbi:Clavesin-1 [Halotydeus destructor]|nr:Clavesin-1 [Halotydeus destructor]